MTNTALEAIASSSGDKIECAANSVTIDCHAVGSLNGFVATKIHLIDRLERGFFAKKEGRLVPLKRQLTSSLNWSLSERPAIVDEKMCGAI